MNSRKVAVASVTTRCNIWVAGSGLFASAVRQATPMDYERCDGNGGILDWSEKQHHPLPARIKGLFGNSNLQHKLCRCLNEDQHCGPQLSV